MKTKLLPASQQSRFEFDPSGSTIHSAFDWLARRTPAALVAALNAPIWEHWMTFCPGGCIVPLWPHLSRWHMLIAQGVSHVLTASFIIAIFDNAEYLTVLQFVTQQTRIDKCRALVRHKSKRQA